MLSTSIGGIPIDCCVYNASGPRTGTAEALSKIAGSRAGAVLAKSATLVKQSGNVKKKKNITTCIHSSFSLAHHLLPLHYLFLGTASICE